MPPEVGDRFRLESRESDIVEEVGTALLKSQDPYIDRFIGWVTKDDLAKTIGYLKGWIKDVERFYWRAGGGYCYQGTMELEE